MFSIYVDEVNKTPETLHLCFISILTVGKRQERQGTERGRRAALSLNKWYTLHQVSYRGDQKHLSKGQDNQKYNIKLYQCAVSAKAGHFRYVRQCALWAIALLVTLLTIWEPLALQHR